MNRSPKKYAESLVAFSRSASPKQGEKAAGAVAEYFTRRGNMKFLRMLRGQLELCIKKEQQRIDAELSSAHEMNAQTLAELQQALEERFGSPVTLQARTNPDLIAGSILTCEDQMVDCSIASRLHLLSSRLSS
jgi:F-type H+-transporting ATPase subunit delta